MEPRSAVKEVIDTWQEWLAQVRQDQVPRDLPLRFSKKFALAVIGVRRSGKSFIAARQVPSPAETLCVNFEDPFFIDHHHISILDELVSVYTEYRNRSPRFLFLDEIHNIPGWERWVRKMIDLKRFQIMLTGSSAKMLSSELATSLTGRCITQTVWPLSFAESMRFRGVRCERADEYLGELRHYFTWGGFPEVVLTPAEAEKKVILNQYLTDILYKDIIKRNEVRTPRSLEHLVVYYLTNTASLHSYTRIHHAFGLNVETAQDYTRFLQDAFLVFEMNRYHPNLKVQARDPKKVYCIDAGLRHANTASPTDDLGKLAENTVYIELRRRGKEIFYFKENGEVDFLLTSFGKPMEAIQVCYSDLEDAATWKREVESLIECLQATRLSEGIVLTLKREETQRISGKTIHLIPLYKWLLGSES